MPPPRRWTLLLVPDGCDSSRTFSISERMLRRLLAAGSTIGLVAMLGIGLWISRLSVRARAASSAYASDSDVELRARLEALDDTLQAIERRDAKIRLLAGLPADTTAGDRESGGTMLGTLAMEQADVDLLIRRANSLAASFAEVSDTLARHAEKFARLPSIMPTAGWLSSNFTRSRFHPVLHYARPHEGIDVSAPMGAPIVAPAAGTVTKVARQNGYGNVLEIDHGYGIVTRYAHCSRIVVRVGQHVKRGQTVANVGSSGLSTGPHLHYEIHVNGKVVDPLTYVLPDGAITD